LTDALLLRNWVERGAIAVHESTGNKYQLVMLPRSLLQSTSRAMR
jgi:hypothetical protein